MAFTRRPHFDDGRDVCGCPHMEGAEVLAALEESNEHFRLAEEGGRWVPPTGLPPQAAE